MKAKHFLMCGLVAAIAGLSGCVQNGAQSQQSVVTVSGTGTVSVEPDMVRMNVSMSKTAQTTRLAQEAVGKMATQVLAILKDAGIEDKDIQTASLRFNPDYEWRNGRSVLVGQRAEQSIDITVRDIGQDTEKVARLIDRISEIDGIMMNQIDFSVADKTEYFELSRERAFIKAWHKANQFAELSGRELGKVLSITEDEAKASVLSPLASRIGFSAMVLGIDSDNTSTELPLGQNEIKTKIAVTFLLE